MSEKRFKSTIDEDTMDIMPYLVSDNEEEAFYNLQGCVDLLNEQQATINELTKNRDRWRELAKLHNGYFNCLEKAIEKAYEEKPYPKIEDIMDIYSELEKEFEDE